MSWGANVGYVVTNSGHPVYAGTGFRDGDVVPRLVGYEMDRYMAEYPLPAHTTRAVLSHSPYTDIEGKAEYAESSIYRARATRLGGGAEGAVEAPSDKS